MVDNGYILVVPCDSLGLHPLVKRVECGHCFFSGNRNLPNNGYILVVDNGYILVVPCDSLGLHPLVKRVECGHYQPTETLLIVLGGCSMWGTS